MAIIYSYPDNLNILLTDMLIGTSTIKVAGKKKNITKNFTVEALGKVISTANPTVWGTIIGSLNDQTDLQAALDSKQNNITLTTIGSNGPSTLIGSVLNIPNYFTAVPTKTSELINDGEDGINPFITLADIPPSTIPNLNDVLLEGNISQLDAKIGELYLYDGPNVNYGKISIQDDFFSVSRANSGTSMVSVDNGYSLTMNNGAANATIINPLTTNRTYTLPDASGTIALTSDIPAQGLTSVGLTMPVAFNVANSPLTSDGTIAVSAAGTSSQYIRGDGQLATLPTGAGGGSTVAYYLNGSINASVAGYKQLSNTATIGGGTDFTLVGNGLIAQFLTDIGDPNRLEIPGGAWNFEMFFQASSAGGSQKFYVELLKYDGTTFTSIASSVSVAEEITGGTTIDLYLTSLAVPTTPLLVTDRLAIRVYIVDNSGGRTITLHTEDNTLCEIITTFSGGVTSLNGLTANTQYLAVGTTGTNFNISSLGDTHTFNIPYAGLGILGGLLTNGTQTFAGNKTFDSGYIYLKNTDSANIGSIQSFSQGFTFKRDATNFQFAVTGGNLYLYSLINNSIVASIGTQPLTASRTYLLPNNSGTFALVSDIGIYSLNGLITSSQTLATGTSGTNFNISSIGSTHTFNLPDASITARGVVTVNNQSFAGLKNFTDNIIVNTIKIWRGSNNSATNIGIGLNVLDDNSGNQNTVIGYQAASSLLSTSSFATAVGYQALFIGKGNQNTAIGWRSLYTNTGSFNTALGYQSLFSNTAGTYNTAVGNGALYNTTLANGNTAIGYQSLYTASALLSDNNVAIGYSAGFSITSGSNNVMIGYATNPLDPANNNSIVIGAIATGVGSNSVVLGNGSILTTILRGQTLIGTTTVGAPTYGSTPQLVVANPFSNVGGVIDIRNLNTNIIADSLLGRIQFTGKSDALVGFTSAAIEAISTGSMGTGNNGGGALKFMTSPGSFPTNPIERMRIAQNGTVQPGTDNAYSLGASGIRWSAVWAANGTIQTSDEREKKDIVDSDLGLDFISKLRPVSFKWKVGKNEVTNELDGLDEDGNPKTKTVVTPIEGKRTHYGLIAQEVETALGGKDFGGFIHDKETDIKGLRYDQLIPVMINAIKELKAEIEILKAK